MSCNVFIFFEKRNYYFTWQQEHTHQELSINDITFWGGEELAKMWSGKGGKWPVINDHKMVSLKGNNFFVPKSKSFMQGTFPLKREDADTHTIFCPFRVVIQCTCTYKPDISSQMGGWITLLKNPPSDLNVTLVLTTFLQFKSIKHWYLNLLWMVNTECEHIW